MNSQILCPFLTCIWIDSDNNHPSVRLHSFHFIQTSIGVWKMVKWGACYYFVKIFVWNRNIFYPFSTNLMFGLIIFPYSTTLCFGFKMATSVFRIRFSIFPVIPSKSNKISLGVMSRYYIKIRILLLAPEINTNSCNFIISCIMIREILNII